MSNKEMFPLSSERIEGKDIKSILFQYTRFWYLFLLSGVIGIGLAYFYLNYYAVPEYKTYSTLLIKNDERSQALSNADAFSDLPTFRSNRKIDNEVEVLKSKSLMKRVVTELGLGTSYFVEGKFKDREVYGSALPINVLVNQLDSTAIGKSFAVYLKSDNSFDLDDFTGNVTSHSFGQQIRKPYGTFTIVAASGRNTSGNKIIVRFQDIQNVAEHYNQAMLVSVTSKDASVLSLTLVDPLPEKARNIINKLMEVYNKENIEDKNVITSNTLKFLDERLKYVTLELSSAEKASERYKSVNGLTDITTEATNYSERASDYNKQLSDWAIQIDVLESIESYLQNPTNQFTMVPSSLGIKDETLLSLLGKFNELQLERERMLRTTQPSNPLVINLNEQLANLRVNILENLANIKKGLKITSNNLKSNFGQFESKIRKVPTMQREMLEINRQQAIKNNIYEYLLQKREETALSLAATASTSRVIDPAMSTDFPISPNTKVIYLMSLLLGLGLPFASLYLRNMLNDKVLSQQDVTSVVPAPIIGEIAHNKKVSGQGPMIMSKGNRTPIAEMFRLVRANLHFAAIGKQNLVLLVTSSMSGEGKTFFSVNLAASLALTGKRVVVLDMDLRDPKIARELKLADGPGITDYIVEQNVGIDDILRPSESIPDLFLVTSGPIPPNPTELMLSSKLAHLIHELREMFDYIIIDTPPIGQVADAFTLSSFIDFAIYVIRYNYTRKGQLKIIENICRNKTLNSPLLVLNDAKEANGNNYGYGYGYGYGKEGSTKKKVTQE